MKENLNATQGVNAPLAIASTSSSGAITSFEEISPIPRFQKPKQTRRKQQTAEVPTTVEKREALRRKASLPTKKKGGKVQQKKKRKDSSSSASSAPDNLVMTSGESDIEEEDDDFCIECWQQFAIKWQRNMTLPFQFKRFLAANVMIVTQEKETRL
uniref:Uncharacterized protein n=1 Tax=Rhodnius prolixus TaxID=13249 RepID=T1HU37_RHOPR